MRILIKIGLADSFADAPRYSRGLVIAASCACAAAVVILVWKLLYRLVDRANMGGKGVKDMALD